MDELAELTAAVARVEAKLDALLAAIDEDVAEDYAQAMTLDGTPMPAERDQNQPLSLTIRGRDTEIQQITLGHPELRRIDIITP
jgi:hypothetical protein